MLNQSYAENSPFGILQNLSAGSDAMENSSSVDLSQKKRKLSESSVEHELADSESLGKRFKSDQHEFLYNYFLQNEQNDDVKRQQKHNLMDVEYLYQFYQINELKKKGINFDYLYQYYMQNEKKQSDMSPNANDHHNNYNSNEKPSIDFLLQYYQINESKKFFQLDASPPQTIPDSNSLQTSMMLQMINNLQQKQQQQSNSSTLSPSPQTNTGRRGSAANTSAASNNSAATKSVIFAAGVQSSVAAVANSLSSNSSNTSSTDHVTSLFNVSVSSELNAPAPSAITTAEKQNNKRLRTTILPEQLNFLYECYQNESNPSRKMLEEISKKVNLKKRVVQVTF